MSDVRQHVQHLCLERLAKDGILHVELDVGAKIGVLEDVGVVVVAHNLVAHSFRRLAVNRVPHISPPVLGPAGLLVAHIERLPSHVVVEGAVGERRVKIAVTAPEKGPL